MRRRCYRKIAFPRLRARIESLSNRWDCPAGNSVYVLDARPELALRNAGPLCGHSITRREWAGRVAGAGLAAAPLLQTSVLRAQAPAVIVPATGPVPAWDTELRKLAPNVYAYQQAGGPGKLNQGVSNAGIVVGEDSIL